jgi:hypothetical protein
VLVPDEVADRLERDRGRPNDDQDALDRGGQVLDLLVPVAVALVRRLSRLRTEKKATIDATRSMLECTASVRIDTEPVIDPATTLSRIRTELEATDRAAVLTLM